MSDTVALSEHFFVWEETRMFTLRGDSTDEVIEDRSSDLGDQSFRCAEPE
jgi:hypothetical protein